MESLNENPKVIIWYIPTVRGLLKKNFQPYVFYSFMYMKAEERGIETDAVSILLINLKDKDYNTKAERCVLS